MPLFVFEVVDGSYTQDVIEITLGSVREARLQAIRFAGEVMAFESAALLARGQLRVDLRDAADRLLFSIACRISDPAPRSVMSVPERGSIDCASIEARQQ